MLKALKATKKSISDMKLEWEGYIFKIFAKILLFIVIPRNYEADTPIDCGTVGGRCKYIGVQDWRCSWMFRVLMRCSSLNLWVRRACVTSTGSELNVLLQVHYEPIRFDHSIVLYEQHTS